MYRLVWIVNRLDLELGYYGLFDSVIALFQNYSGDTKNILTYNPSKTRSEYFANTNLKIKLRGLSPLANYTDRATAAFRRS
jgi:hypothetical protein